MNYFIERKVRSTFSFLATVFSGGIIVVESGKKSKCPGGQLGTLVLKRVIRRAVNVQSETITRASVIITISTLLSRLIGFVRQMLVAYYYGAKAVTDAFFASLVLPGLFTSLVDAVPTVFVPVFLQEREARGEYAAWRGARKVFGIVFLYLFTAFFVGLALTPYALRILVPGFDVRRFELALYMSYALLPLILVQGMNSLLKSTYEAHRIFSFPTAANLLVTSLMLIFVLLFNRYPVVSLAIGYVFSLGVYGLLLAVVAKLKWPLIGFEYTLNDPMIRKIFKLILPIYLGSSLGYLNLFVDRVFASMLPEGSVSALNYAIIIKDIPLGLFAASVSQVIYPTTASQVAQGKLESLRALVSRSLEAIWLFIIPSMLGFLVLPEQTVRAVYERGQFGLLATKTTAEALFFYTLSMFASASVSVTARVFFSLNDTKTPVKISALALVMNIVLNSLLVRRYAHIGLALATSMSTIFAALLLLELLRRRLGGLNGLELLVNTTKIISASLCMMPVLIAFKDRANLFFGYLFTVSLAALVYGLVLIVVKPRSVQLMIVRVKLALSKKT